MANTLKFGAGNWATKEGSTLAYNDENDNYKPLPFTFTRASNATVVNKAGLIETLGNGIPRIDFLGNTQGALKLEPQRTNLITYSSDFPNPYWTKGGASIQGDPSTAGSELIVNGDFATDSDWIKGTGWTISGGKASCDGSNSALDQFSITTIGKTYKVDITVTDMTTASVNVRLGTGSSDIIGSITSNGTYTFYGTVASNTAFRIRSSAGFDGSVDNVSVKEVQGFTSLDGTTNAYKLVEGTNNGNHQIYSGFFSGSSGNNYTTSFFVKAAERTWCKILNYGGTQVFFDLGNGVVGTETNASGKIEALSNDWYKISMTYVSQSSERAYLYIAESNNTNSYQGNGTSGIYVFGAQAEEGSCSSSLINTQGSAVTRSRDLCDTQNLSHVIGQTEGVIFYDAILVHKSTSTSEDLFELSIDDGSANNIFFINNYNNTLVVGLNNGGSNQFYSNSYNPTEGARYKLAFAYKQNDFALYINGNQIATDSSGTVPAMNQITFGNYYNNSVNLSNSVKVNDFKLYNTRLSNSELAALTQV